MTPVEARDIRELDAADAPALGDLLFAAFSNVASRHGHEPDFADLRHARAAAAARLRYPDGAAFGIRRGSELLAAVLAEPRGPWVCLGPVAVHPESQGGGMGSALLARARAFAADRPSYLLQDAFNALSLGLYVRHGFSVQGTVVICRGTLRAKSPAGAVRPITDDDRGACQELARQAFSYSRAREIELAVEDKTGCVLERDGRLAAYLTDPSSWQVGHGAAQSEADLCDLLSGLNGPVAVMIPVELAATLRWALVHGLRAFKLMNVMATCRRPSQLLPAIVSVHG